MSGIAEKHHPAAAPPGQARQLNKGPEAHIPLDVTHEIEDASIPGVFLEDAKSLVSGRRDTVREPRPGREAIRLVDSKQIHQLTPVEPVTDDVRTRSAPDMQRSRIRQILRLVYRDDTAKRDLP